MSLHWQTIDIDRASLFNRCFSLISQTNHIHFVAMPDQCLGLPLYAGLANWVMGMNDHAMAFR